jgi:hypothetical protein
MINALSAVVRASRLPAVLLLASLLTGAAQVQPEPTTTPAVKKVRISFLPPPLEGTISLGIYDSDRKLVRILHREADIKDFHIGADALSTTWDGRDEANADLPPGKYSARGYVVGQMKVEFVGPAGDPSLSVPAKVALRLVANPLAPGEKRTLEICAGMDEDASYIQTVDGLPLFTVDEAQDLTNVFVAQRGDKSLDFYQNDGDTLDQFHISGVDKMMAFDCGDFELK